MSKESPCARGKVICFSLFCGSDVDFCDGNNLGEPKTMLWVDTLLDDEVRLTVDPASIGAGELAGQWSCRASPCSIAGTLQP